MANQIHYSSYKELLNYCFLTDLSTQLLIFKFWQRAQMYYVVVHYQMIPPFFGVALLTFHYVLTPLMIHFCSCNTCIPMTINYVVLDKLRMTATLIVLVRKVEVNIILCRTHTVVAEIWSGEQNSLHTGHLQGCVWLTYNVGQLTVVCMDCACLAAHKSDIHNIKRHISPLLSSQWSIDPFSDTTLKFTTNRVP